MRYKRFVQMEQRSLTRIFFTPRLTSETDELFNVTLFQLMA